MSESNYRPSGELQGDARAMPDRGNGTGMSGQPTDMGGMSINPDATNSIGSMTGDCKSDPMDECCVNDPTFGPAPGDSEEDKKEGY